MKFKQPGIFYYLAGLLFLINCAQSIFTDLIYDEAYYWHYAQELTWGYFDHPPMVAFLIKISSFIAGGELGVRFLSCVLSVGTVFLLWRSIENPEKNRYVPHFFVLVCSMTLVNAYGFLTLPDTPLLFFLALFIFVYKKFIDKPGLILALFLGLSMALLMYSKYHAALIIIFVFLSNLNLAKNKFAWLAVIFGVLCYAPHLVWLYENNFVSIQYHLFERPNRAYSFADFTLGFFINLIVLFGLTFPWIYKSLFKTKAENLFTRALLFLIYGFILFFFISSFNRRIQTQWLIAICVPMAIITFEYMLKSQSTLRWITRSGLVNLVVLLYLRIGLAYDPIFPIHYESHGNKEWVQGIVSEIGEMPVIFENSYRRAPMYEFYSGNASFSLNNIYYRQNQFSIDNSEAPVQHQKVLYVSKNPKKSDLVIKMPGGSELYGVYIGNFESFRKLRCYVDSGSLTEIPEEWTFELFNPYDGAIDLSKLRFGIAYLNEYKQVQETKTLPVRLLQEGREQIKAGEKLKFAFKPTSSKMKDPAYFKICISENKLPYGLNGRNIKLPR